MAKTIPVVQATLALKSLTYLTSNNAYMCEEAYLTTNDAYMCHETFSFMLLLPATSLEQQKGWDGGRGGGSPRG